MSLGGCTEDAAVVFDVRDTGTLDATVTNSAVDVSSQFFAGDGFCFRARERKAMHRVTCSASWVVDRVDAGSPTPRGPSPPRRPR